LINLQAQHLLSILEERSSRDTISVELRLNSEEVVGKLSSECGEAEFETTEPVSVATIISLEVLGALMREIWASV
jgi:hypothetical protein